MIIATVQRHPNGGVAAKLETGKTNAKEVADICLAISLAANHQHGVMPQDIIAELAKLIAQETARHKINGMINSAFDGLRRR